MKLDTSFLRPRKAVFLERLYDIFRGDHEPLSMTAIANGCVCPPSAENPAGEVRVVSSGKVVNEERILYCGRLMLHWGHFLLESLTRLWPLFTDDAPQVDAIVYTLMPGEEKRIAPTIREAFELAGVADKVKVVTSPACYREIVVPDRCVEPRARFCRECKPIFDRMARAAGDKIGLAGKKSGRIYLSRGQLPKARLNEPCSGWVDDFFESNGFTILYPEKMSLAETICRIREASIVAAISGTLPHNMLFAEDGADLWILEKTPLLNNFQQGVDLLRNLSVTPVDCNAQFQTVDAGLGPFVIYPNSHFMRFAESKNLKAPDSWGNVEKKKALKKFIALYRRHYGYGWQLNEWEEAEIGSLREAYRESAADFREALSGVTPLFFYEKLKPRLFAKWLVHFFRR